MGQAYLPIAAVPWVVLSYYSLTLPLPFFKGSLRFLTVSKALAILGAGHDFEFPFFFLGNKSEGFLISIYLSARISNFGVYP